MRTIATLSTIGISSVILAASTGCGPGDDCTVTATCVHEGGGGTGAGNAGGSSSSGGGPQGGGGSGGVGGTGAGGTGGGPAPMPGDVLWEASYGDAAADEVAAAALTPDGDLVLAGSFEGSLDFGGGALVSGGAEDVFVAKLEAASGTAVWAKQYGGVGNQTVTGMDGDASGNVLLVGDFDGTINFGAGALTATDNPDQYVAKLGANGDGLWSSKFDAAGGSSGPAAVSPSGSLVSSGRFNDTIQFGSTTLSGAQQADHTFLTSRSGVNGQVDWAEAAYSNAYGNYVSPLALAVDTAGNVAFFTRVNQQIAQTLSVTYDGGSESQPASPNFSSFGVLFRTDSLGGYAWHKRISPQVDISMYANGDVLVCGVYSGSGTFADGFNLPTSQGTDVFAARYSSTGTLLWSRRYGGPGADGGTASPRVACAALADGSHLIAALAEGAFDIGSTTVPGNAPGVVVGAVDDSGQPVWTQRVSGTCNAVHVTSSTDVAAVVIGFDDAVGIGSSFTSAGGSDVYVGALAL